MQHAMDLTSAQQLGQITSADKEALSHNFEDVSNSQHVVKSMVNIMNNQSPVLLPYVSIGTSMRMRTMSSTVTIPPHVETAGLMGAPSTLAAISSIQLTCIHMARLHSTCPDRSLVLGAMQPQLFKPQNTVTRDTRTRVHKARDRSEIPGVVPSANFPGMHQPAGVQADNGDRLANSQVFFAHMGIQLGASNSVASNNQKVNSDRLVPLGASVSAWHRATRAAQDRWTVGIYDDALRAKKRTAPAITCLGLRTMLFRRKRMARLSTRGSLCVAPLSGWMRRVYGTRTKQPASDSM